MSRRMCAVGLGAAALALAALAASAGAAQDNDRERGARHAGNHGERLGSLIQQRLRADGPFFTAEERAVIERACGYAPGSWDGFEANMSDGEFICTNGRRADSPEVRAVMEAAGPRIGARVSRVMASAEVRDEIAAISERASAAALRAVEWERIAERAQAQAIAATRRALEQMETAGERRRR